MEALDCSQSTAPAWAVGTQKGRSTVPNTDTRPHGRGQVPAALIDASAQLFAERLPHQVSVREIAAR